MTKKHLAIAAVAASILIGFSAQAGATDQLDQLVPFDEADLNEVRGAKYSVGSASNALIGLLLPTYYRVGAEKHGIIRSLGSTAYQVKQSIHGIKSGD